MQTNSTEYTPVPIGQDAESSRQVEAIIIPTVDLRLVQFSPEWMNPESNLDRALSVAQNEAKDGADIIVFPELANLGYITPIRQDGKCEYRDLSAAQFRQLYSERAEVVPGPFTEELSKLADSLEVLVIIGMARRSSGQLYNSAVLMGPGGQLEVQDKIHLPLNERRFFQAGRTVDVFDTPYARIGLTVCYDTRFPEIARIHAMKGADLDVSVLAGPDSMNALIGTDETIIYRSHVRALENGVFSAMCNRVGTEGTSRFLGNSAVSSPTGAILAKGGRGEEVVRAELREEELNFVREQLGVLADRRPSVYIEAGMMRPSLE